MLLLNRPTDAQVAVAGNQNASTTGNAQLVGTAVRAPARPALATGADTVLGDALRGRLFSLSRASGLVQIIDRRTWRVRRRFALGAESQLEDMAVADRCTAYLTRRNATHLLRLDLCTGATADVVDLGFLADVDGIPDLGALVIDDGRLFVQVRRYNNDAIAFIPPAYLAVVDLATETLIDTDPATPGSQPITLAGTAAKYRMQVVHATRRLYVGATGAVMDGGGIEAIDLDTLRSEGLVIRESDGLTGADIGPFVMVSPERGYLIFTTDFDLSSHLQRFSLSGGVDPGPHLNVSVGYAVPALAFDPIGGTLFLPEGAFGLEGLHVFDAATGLRLTTDPIPTDGRPTDCVSLRTLPRP